MIVFEALFFILPAYTANGFASLSRSIPIIKNWTTPIDFGKNLFGKRLLGDGKTYRGFIVGTFFSLLIGTAQFFFSRHLNFNYLKDLNNSPLSFFLLLSVLLGSGALLGDIVKSFIKRRIGINRGRPWPPFDQLDFIAGGILLSSIVYFPGWKILTVLVIITPIIHLLSNVIAYLLKLKDVWW